MTSPPPTPPPRYLMIGGFLGAGKTTAMGRLAKHLSDQGLRVGLITNDQAGGLVDTRLLRSQGFVTEEIAGGCFCCRFNSLMDAAGRLSEEARPDVFLAEPVGSCTDLVATVTYPLRRMYGDSFIIAPLSVLVDPMRARRILGLEDGAGFSSKVTYIFRKQLEEADVIVINKRDTVNAEQERELREALRVQFPHAQIFAVSSRDGSGLDAWFYHITHAEQQARSTMTVDYDLYADGEALLGWLNATVALSSTDEFDANDLLKSLAREVRGHLLAHAAEVAHFKMTFSPDDSLSGELASINLVRNDQAPQVGMELDEPTESGLLIINLRAEAAPEDLAAWVRAALAAVTPEFPGLTANVEHEEHFRPGRPTPTHRDQS